jgi:ketosteroid isomerase-like protein
MNTRETVDAYFDRLHRKNGWASLLADDLAFTSLTSPVKQVRGKDAFLQATKRFYSSIAIFTVRDLIVEGEKACALTRYTIQPPSGNPAFESDVAEIFTVRDGKIDAFTICFDSVPFPK